MPATWVQKSLANDTWDPFGTKSRPGCSRMLQVRKTFTPKSTFWAENVAPRPDYGSNLGAQMFKKRDFDAKLALGPSKK